MSRMTIRSMFGASVRKGFFLTESFRPPGDVGVHAGAADFLADFIDDEDVDMGKLQSRHLLFSQGFAERRRVRKKFIRRDDF